MQKLELSVDVSIELPRRLSQVSLKRDLISFDLDRSWSFLFIFLVGLYMTIFYI